MKKISYDGIGAVVATFNCEGNVATGQVVKVNLGSTVEGCKDGDLFVGTVFDYADGLASVQVKGFVEVSVTGVVPLGNVSLVADGMGGVKVGDGISALVVDNSHTGFVTLCL